MSRFLLAAAAAVGVGVVATWAGDAAAAEPSQAAAPVAHPPANAAPGAPGASGATEATAEKLRWRDTWFIWDHTVSAQTVGVGKSYLSSNPYYEMSASIRPRYYLYDRDVDAVFAAGRIDVSHEFTNSDVTTRRGETTASDATLLLGYRRTLASEGASETTLGVRAPVLTLPTSKFSFASGTIAGLGADVRLAQTLPLAGEASPVFQRVTLAAFTGYSHTFTRAVVPTNSDLRRVRTDPEGRPVASDQLTGVAFPEHELSIGGRLLTQIASRLLLALDIEYRPTWKYPFGSVDVCTTTGCAPATRPLDPSTYVPVTRFEVGAFYDVIDELGLGLAYSNVETQLGPDGQRRSLFTSPGAQISLSLVAHLDAMYLAAAGRRVAAPGPTRLRP
jgi:hypothetical protein